METPITNVNTQTNESTLMIVLSSLNHKDIHSNINDDSR